MRKELRYELKSMAVHQQEEPWCRATATATATADGIEWSPGRFRFQIAFPISRTWHLNHIALHYPQQHPTTRINSIGSFISGDKSIVFEPTSKFYQETLSLFDQMRQARLNRFKPITGGIQSAGASYKPSRSRKWSISYRCPPSLAVGLLEVRKGNCVEALSSVT